MGCAGSSPSREEDSPPEKPPPPKAAPAPAAPKPQKPAAASGTSKRLSTLLGGQKVRSQETVEKLKEEKEELLVEDPTKARANAVTKFGPNVKKLRSSGFALRYACVSQRGYNPDDLYEANQDAYGVMDDFSKMYGVDASVVPDLLLGVFDGSGVEGEGCAQYLRREFGKQVVKSLDVFKTDFVVGYKDAMERLNQALIEDDGADASESGSTALTACFHGNLMHVCNVRLPASPAGPPPPARRRRPCSRARPRPSRGSATPAARARALDAHSHRAAFSRRVAQRRRLSALSPLVPCIRWATRAR
jgi:hypothetical protein